MLVGMTRGAAVAGGSLRDRLAFRSERAVAGRPVGTGELPSRLIGTSASTLRALADRIVTSACRQWQITLAQAQAYAAHDGKITYHGDLRSLQAWPG